MKEEHYFYAPDSTKVAELNTEETVHAVCVLRLKAGDEIVLMDGEGCFHKAEITFVSAKKCEYSVTETVPQTPIWNGRIHLAMAPTKMMERVEWFAEKATEIGCDEFSFLECKNSERRQIRIDRIEKTVVSAMKQSRKAWKPTVNELQKFKTFVDSERDGLKLIAHCHRETPAVDLFALLDDTRQAAPNVTVLIGPEGDFSTEEVEYALAHGYQSVSLGRSRLRTETAALAAVMTAQLCRRKI